LGLAIDDSPDGADDGGCGPPGMSAWWPWARTDVGWPPPTRIAPRPHPSSWSGRGRNLRRTLTEATGMGFVEHRPTAGIMGRAAPVFPPRLTIKLLARRSPRPGPAGLAQRLPTGMAGPASCALPAGQRTMRCGCAPHHFVRYGSRRPGPTLATRHCGEPHNDVAPRIPTRQARDPALRVGPSA
jgi:hypothetical protein